jgi:intein-encoded DNA endonuclease-like protein
VPILKNVNKDFFKKWTPEMAYVLGFFAADGNLIKNKRGACFFSLEICDKGILDNIKKVMESNHKIGIRVSSKENYKVRYRLQIGSKEIYEDLLSLGFGNGKTYNMSVPLIPDEYFSDFVRGYFDGDGNVWLSKGHKKILIAFTSSSRLFLEGLSVRLKKLGITLGGSLVDYKTYYRISYSIQDSLKIYSFMYNSEHYGLLYLSRKKEVFDRFIVNNRVAAVAQR